MRWGGSKGLPVDFGSNKLVLSSRYFYLDYFLLKYIKILGSD